MDSAAGLRGGDLRAVGNGRIFEGNCRSRGQGPRPVIETIVNSASSNCGGAEMKSKLLMPLGLVVGLLAACGPIFAHHGSAAYAETVVVLKDSTVTKFVWANP